MVKQMFLMVMSVVLLTACSVQEWAVMSYNVRLDVASDGENRWDNRKAFLVDRVQFYGPDIMGVQEALPHQMKEMDSLLSNYSYVGVGRDDGKDKGEYSAIFYNKNRFEVLQTNTFWLSQTPSKVSMGWDAVCNRVCTYALFREKESGQQFWMFNTHFDHVGIEARKNSTALIVKKIQELNTKKYPVFLTGDFNMEENNESIQYLGQFLQDSKTVSKHIFGPEGTFNGFEFSKPVNRRIDYIFVSKNVEVKNYAVLSDNKDCRYPSDHLPVFAKVLIK